MNMSGKENEKTNNKEGRKEESREIAFSDIDSTTKAPSDSPAGRRRWHQSTELVIKKEYEASTSRAGHVRRETERKALEGLPTEVRNWSVDDVGVWASRIANAEAAEMLRSEAVFGECLVELEDVFSKVEASVEGRRLKVGHKFALNKVSCRGGGGRGAIRP